MSNDEVRREFDAQLDSQRNGGAPAQRFPELPERCWDGPYGEFRDIAHPASEAADEFHYLAMDAALSMALGRGPYVDYVSRLRLTCSNVAMGPSGDSHKGTPVHYATKLLKDADIEYQRFSNLASVEGLAEQMREGGRNVGLCAQAEMSIITDNSRRPGTQNLPASLCELYDCVDPWVITKRRSPPIEKPYVCVIGGTTPDWGERLAGLNLETGGWINRQFILYGDSERMISRPRRPDEVRWMRIADRLRAIHQKFQHGEFEVTLTDEAWDWWDGWYRRWKAGRRSLPEAQRGISGRADVHTLKGASKRALWRGSDVVEVADLEPAALAAESMVRVKLALFAEVQMSPQGKLELRILERHPGGEILISQLHERVGGRYGAREVWDACLALSRLGRLVLREEQKPGRRSGMWVSKI